MASNGNTFVMQFRFPMGKYMRLPPKFMEKWGHHFGNFLNLKARDTKIWKIGLEHDDDDNFWLTINWDYFKKYYNIEFRDSMYFMYKGDCEFDVVLFSLHGMEKTPSRPCNRRIGVFFSKKMMTKTFDTKMVVPEEFCTGFGNNLVNPMTVFSWDNMQYRVKWTADEQLRNITFTDGWENIVKVYEIKYNDLLVFYFGMNKFLKVDLIPQESRRIDQFHMDKTPDPWDINDIERRIWTTDLTYSSAAKGQPLYVPAKVMNTEFPNKPKKINVRLESGYIKEWHMIYSVARNETKLGRGWYEFKESNKLKSGYVLRFTRRGMQDFINLEVARYGSRT